MKTLLMTVVLLGLMASMALAQPTYLPVPQLATPLAPPVTFDGSGPVAGYATFEARVLTFASVTIQPPAPLSIQGALGTEDSVEPEAGNDDPDISAAAGDGGLIEWEFNDNIACDIEATQFNGEQTETSPSFPPPGGEKLWTAYQLGDWWEAMSKTSTEPLDTWMDVPGWTPDPDFVQIEDGTAGNYGGQVLKQVQPGVLGPFNANWARYGRLWWGVQAKNLEKDEEGNYTIPASKDDYWAAMIVTLKSPL